MKQNAKVKSLDGDYALVEVTRTSACEACGQSGVCSACKKLVSVRARNDAGASVGDMVTVESGSGRVLGSAAAVFVLPLAAAFVVYFLLDALKIEGLPLTLIPCALFIAVFAAACLILDRRERRNPDVTITEINEPPVGVEKSEEKNDM